MHLYQLNEHDSATFLKGLPVNCDAVLPLADCTSEKIKEGSKIVVRLKNGNKFMGKVVSFRYQIQGTYAVGTLEILRHPMPAV